MTAAVDRLNAIMARLRDPDDGCPWDVEQTFTTIAPYTIEEAYEVADAIERGDMDELKSELGDLLFQVVFHARMAEEQGLFAFDDVVNAIADKLERRHPHVFGDEAAKPDGAARGLIGVLFFYFFEQARGFDREQTSIMLLVYFVAGLVGAPIWAALATRIGKHIALAVASVFFAVTFAGATLLVPSGNFPLALGAIFITGLAFGSGDLLLRAMMADPEPTYEEVSRALDMPIGSIGPTRQRALACLRQRLEESERSGAGPVGSGWAA